jgi:hypothetical protein
MPLLSEMTESRYIKAFVMGEPGTGKTVAACSFPGPIKVYDFDGKLSSAYAYLKKNNPEKLKEIDYEVCVPTDGIGSGYAKMDESLEKILDEYKKTGKIAYQTLVIDSSTIMAEDMLNWLLNFETGIKRNAAVKSRKVAGQQDYLIFAPTFSAFLYEILTPPWNVVMTGHIQVKQDEKTGEIRRVAAIPGKMGSNIGIYFNELYRSQVINGKYVIQTQADLYYPCRSQLQGIPNPCLFSYAELAKYLI